VGFFKFFAKNYFLKLSAVMTTSLCISDGSYINYLFWGVGYGGPTIIGISPPLINKI
jgi:hypothetical protein